MNLAYGFVSTYLMYYLTQTIGMRPEHVGVLFMATLLVNAALTPAMGLAVDATR
jgi:Na+/melibiose symporter-like transporter